MTPPPPQSERSLIITGDDFGLNSRVNEAVEHDYQAGVLTQASLMVNETAVDEAVRIARRNPGLRVGLHLSLCAGRASEKSPLSDAHGNLPLSPAWTGLRYAFDPRLREPLGAEIARQFARFASLGFPPLYWDGHTHLHLHPTVLELTLPHAGSFRAIRLVREPGRAPLPVIFRLLSRAARRRLPGIAAVERTCGLTHTGSMTTRNFEFHLARLLPGWTELYYHPGAEPETPDDQLITGLIALRGIRLGTAADLPVPSVKKPLR